MRAVVFTLGCKVNSCESSFLMSGLASLGYEVSDELGEADLYIINTCAVTAEAEKKSRQAIARAKKFNPNAEIIVTGCASQNSPDDFLKKNNVTLVTGARSKEKILGRLSERGYVAEEYSPTISEPLPLATDKARAYIKVQDGCDNFCSYCIIPYLRGRSRSKSPEEVLREIEFCRPLEAVITGINLSSYSYGELRLKDLVYSLSEVNCRIRLGSLEVNVIDEELLTALGSLKNFAEHFHLSLQAGSDKVLRSMNRHYTAEQFFDKCRLIRRFFPDCGITTDIIVGYSSEDRDDFAASLKLAEKVCFSDIHCFPYSRREGTVGAKLKELPAEEKTARMKEMLALKSRLKKDFIAKNCGLVRDFVPEEYVGGYTVGYTGNYVRCYVEGKLDRKIYKVKTKVPFEDGLSAEII